MKLVPILAALTLLMGCGGSAASSASGIRGRADIGVCAVEQEGMDCTAPFKGEFQVRQNGQVVETVRTDTGGLFEIALPPGTYELAADAGAGALLKPVQVVVRANTFTTVTLSFDSGIR